MALPVSAQTPRERWEVAVGSRPLEAPRALPTAFHAMATALTGRARPPLFTAGPNTRHALAAAGALGATTGTVVHLPALPTSAPAVSAVLAHELTHTRSPVRRPRFLLGGASGLLDDDERQALAAGREAAGAGIVESLPVGGGMGAVGEVATRAARAAIMEASASPVLGGFPSMSAQSAIAGISGTLQDAAGTVTSGLTDAANGLTNGLAGAGGMAGAGGLAGAGGVAGAVGPAGAAGLVGAAGNALGEMSSAADSAKAALDAEQVVEIVERRLLREIERRGGRWAGVF
jgi:hypothetical protein